MRKVHWATGSSALDRFRKRKRKRKRMALDVPGKGLNRPGDRPGNEASVNLDSRVEVEREGLHPDNLNKWIFLNNIVPSSGSS